MWFHYRNCKFFTVSVYTEMSQSRVVQLSSDMAGAHFPRMKRYALNVRMDVEPAGKLSLSTKVTV
jgi:hypothetical protein